MIAASAKAAVEYITYVTEVIESRRKQPREDLISILVRAREDGVLRKLETGQMDHIVENETGQREMSNDELIKLCILLMVAGNETTRNGLSGGMQLLIENPAIRQRLIDDPSLIPGAVEEMLRLVSPVLSFQRTVTRDTEVRGVSMKAGQKVLMIYGSANRDAEEFDDPDAFDIERKPQHVAFGIGNHFCMGANLARMEMRVAFEEFLRRMPDMEYTQGGPEMGLSALVRSVKHMHVRFAPEEAPH